MVRFHTRSGLLTVRRKGTLYEMNFPVCEQKEIPVTDAMEQAFGIRPVKAVLGMDLVCVFETEEQIRSLNPDPSLLLQIDGRIQNATAPGHQTDCVSRSFAPKLAIEEDPVCGSVHCQIAAYWAARLGKTSIDAYQASARGGFLHCELLDSGRIAISGEAVLIAISELAVPLP
ncbi:MAG: PhzF family phenazine biosynthesis protein [Parasporobacterium sp.]|nr:PhzF family phenazine biosynthesis protein [Parasporobacterium sp.]